jgi:hypothetical protein
VNEPAPTASCGKIKDGLSFIHSSLDDFGLTPAQFRIYGHVNRVAGREGVCYQSLKTIAEHCGYCIGVTRDALRFLTDHKLLQRKDKSGIGVEFRLIPPCHWLKPLSEMERGKIDTGNKKTEATPEKNLQGNPSQKILPKGIPIEGIHEREREPEPRFETGQVDISRL